MIKRRTAVVGTFEEKVIKFMGGKAKFSKLSTEEKKTVKRLSGFQTRTKDVYSNGSLKEYESLGIL